MDTHLVIVHSLVDKAATVANPARSVIVSVAVLLNVSYTSALFVSVPELTRLPLDVTKVLFDSEAAIVMLLRRQLDLVIDAAFSNATTNVRAESQAEPVIRDFARHATVSYVLPFTFWGICSLWARFTGCNNMQVQRVEPKATIFTVSSVPNGGYG